jgi:hypothetical protein
MKSKYNFVLILIAVFALFLIESGKVRGQAPSIPGNGGGVVQIEEGGNIPPPPKTGGGAGAQQIGGGNIQLPDPPNPGGGSGSQQIGGGTGGNQLPDPPNPGGGNGSQQIGGGDTIPEPPNPGGGSGFPMGTVLQNITIPAGWSGISSFVIPHLPGLDSLFVNELSANSLVILQHFNQVFWPAFNINTIGNWETHDGYAIKVLQQSQMDIFGFEDSNDTVQFTEGWNYLPVISECDVTTAALFSGLVASGKLIIVYEIAGTGIYHPGYGINTLPVLNPGKAYMVKVTGSCSVSFPGCLNGETNTGTTNSSTPISPWNVVAPTPKQQFIFFQQTTPVLMPGDILGGFTRDGICCGITEFQKSVQKHVLVVFGDDPTTPEKDGFAANEEIRIVKFRPSNAETNDLEFQYSLKPGFAAGNFVVNGISEVIDLNVKQNE